MILTVILVLMLALFIRFNLNRSMSDIVVVQYVFVTVIAVVYVVASKVVGIVSWRHISLLTPEILAKTQFLYILFLLGIFVASLLIRPVNMATRDTSSQDFSWPGNSSAATMNKAGFFALSFLIMGMFLYGLYIKSIGISALFNTSNLAEKYLDSVSVGPFYFGLSLIVISAFCAEKPFVARSIVWICRLTLAATLVWVLFLVNIRWPAVMVAIGYFRLASHKHDLRVRHFQLRWFVWFVLLDIFFEGFSIYRGTLSTGGSFAGVFNNLSWKNQLGIVIGGSELIQPFATAAELVANHSAKPWDLSAFFIQLETLLPRVFLPDRGLSEAQLFAMNNYGTLFDRGGGTGFSTVGSTLIYFPAYIGPFLTGLTLGSLGAALENFVKRRPSSTLAILAPALLYYVFLSERMGLVAFFKQIMLISVVSLLVFVIFSLLRGTAPARRLGASFPGDK